MGKLIDKEDEVVEIVLDDSEIDELIKRLNELKETKSHLHFNVNKKKYECDLLIHHKEDEFLK